MNTKNLIIEYIQQKRSVRGPELCQLLGISRQAVNKHLKELVREGKVVKEGVTRGSMYRYSSARKGAKLGKRIRKTLSVAGLEEDSVFRELQSLLNLQRTLSKGTLDIARYAFTEILNNAVEHSFSEKCLVEIGIDQYRLLFRIRDFGVGIFYSISNKFGLLDENAAIGELIKGKTTTVEEKHTGEGVFFTSKAADVISFRSHRIELVFDNQKKDVLVQERKSIRGTEVVFIISRRTKRQLNRIFEEFAPEEFDYRFERTKALVKLFHRDYVSRSEAKRLLYGLDKFKEVVLDFKGVKSIGQGFADEIFRVFKKEHPDIAIKVENIKPTLRPMVQHVQRAVDNNL